LYEYGENRDKVIDYVYSERKNDPTGENYRTNRGGWQSNDGYYLESNPVRDLVLNSLGNHFNTNSIIKPGVNIYLSACWININKKGDFNVQHDHPGCHMSGVMYLKIPEDKKNTKVSGVNSIDGYADVIGDPVGGEICFANHNSFSSWKELFYYTDEFKKKYSQFGAYYIEPKEGVMLFFPANLRHHVEPSKSDEDRISVSFNADLVPD
tara:strand:+ start:538 stop:1164 length:627 start_codon:yes stop_codon:yes gene_type:complete